MKSNGAIINHPQYGLGKTIGYVSRTGGNSNLLTHIRVQFDSGDVRDFHESKLPQYEVKPIQLIVQNADGSVRWHVTVDQTDHGYQVNDDDRSLFSNPLAVGHTIGEANQCFPAD